MILFGLFGLMLLVLGGRMAWLSLVQHSYYLDKARDNLRDRTRLSYPRGNIFDRQGRTLATNRKVYTATFSSYGLRRSEARESLERIASLAGNLSGQEIEEILDTRPRWTRHEVLEGATQEEVLPFLERPEDFPGIRVHQDFEREYPFAIDSAHLVGYTSRIQPDEVEVYTRPRYLLDAEVGRSGLERLYEDSLAGHPGTETVERDARGRRLAEPELLQSSEPGENLYLYLDAQWQQAAMELLWGREGSIVVMDVQTGGVAVLASRPTFDPLNPAAQVVDGQNAGYVNHAMRGLYPPASTFKVVGALAALESGLSPQHEFVCHGPFRPSGWSRTYWCAHRQGHGPVDLVDSIELSCNVYYYELGHRLGFAPVASAARRFGFAEKTGIDLPGEKAGQLANMDEPPPGETLNLMIGQGSMLATPLQVARAYAGLANGGTLPRPRMVAVKGSSRESGEKHEASGESMGLSRRQLDLITEGLWRVVNSPEGTASSAGFPRRWDVAGKTGTAERPGDKRDAWFAGFFPRSAPRYSFVVHVENAEGSGGEVAAPIAREMIAEILGERQDEEAESEEELARAGGSP